MAGMGNLFHCDINEFGCKVLRYWFPESKEYNIIVLIFTPIVAVGTVQMLVDRLVFQQKSKQVR